MQDRRDDRYDRDRRHHGRDHEQRSHGYGDERHHHHGCHRHRQPVGPDTGFLQLEMSEVLYSEAEPAAKEAFRQLLLEEAKTRLRERFGNVITGLAQLAVDELIQDVLASLEIEARIGERNRERKARRDRLADIVRGQHGSEPAQPQEHRDPEGQAGGGSNLATR